MKKIKEFLTSKEHGYSLLEISVAVGLMVIGMAIAIPNFSKAIDTQQANDLKNHMVSAGMIMESARYQNNGVYPTEIPPEIINNPDYADFTYSVDDNSGNYCIMGRDGTNQKYFSNGNTTEPYTPSEETPGCTEDNVIWTPVDPNEPPAPSLIMGNPSLASGNNVWTRNNYASALADFSWVSGTCDFSGPLPSYMGGVQGIDYQARVIEPSSSNVYAAFGGAYISANSVSNLSLAGLIPGANIEYQVRMRCLADFEYHYTNWVSVGDTVSTFPVSGTGTLTTPAPSTEWGAGQDWPVLKFTAAAIQCPTNDFTPVYKATISQVGASNIVVDWQPSVNFTVSLINYQGNKNVSWAVESGCKINNTIFEQNEPYSGGDAIQNETQNELYIPIPPPSPVTGLSCYTKYDRLTEASSGACTQDETMDAAPTTPEEVRWNQTTCTVGTDGYLIRTQVNGQSFSSWMDLGLNQDVYHFTSGFPVGSTVIVEVEGYCVQNGQTSEPSQSASKSFYVDFPPPATDPIQVTWTPSTDDSSWTETTQQGSGFMYDRFTGTVGGSCTNNVIPNGWKVYIKATFPDGTIRTLTTPKTLETTSLVINRSEWASSQDLYWARGASVSFQVEAQCPSVSGVYAAVFTGKDDYDAAVEIGYPIYANEVATVTCASKDLRTTEASKGNCVYDPTVTVQSYVPNELRWSAITCQTGYSPNYTVKKDGVLFATTTALKTNLSNLVVNNSYNFTVEYQCFSTDAAKYSTASSTSTAKSITTTYPASTTTPSAPTVTWTPSDADTSWASGQQGSISNGATPTYLYDRLTASVSGATCDSGYAPRNFYVRMVSSAGTTGWYSTTYSASVVLNRSALTSWQSAWIEGATFTLESYFDCSSPDYSNTPSSSTNTSTSYRIGYSAPTALISGLNCYIQYTRTTEATTGGCTLDATINMTGRSVAPQELRWTAVSGTACSTKIGSPRYYVSSDGSTWTSNGTSTSYVLPNTLTPGTSYTYYVTYDCYDSTSTIATAKAASGSKTFKASYLKDTDLTNNTATVNYSASTAGTSWSATAPAAGSTSYQLLDQLTITFSSASCPSGYSPTSLSASVAGTSGSVSGTPLTSANSFTISRTTTNAASWYEGAHFRDITSTPSVTCSGGDYGNQTIYASLPAATAAYQIGVNAPSGTPVISNDYVTAANLIDGDPLSGDFISWSLDTAPTCSGGATINNEIYASYVSAAGALSWTLVGANGIVDTTQMTHIGGNSYGYTKHSCSVATTYFGTITGANASSSGTVKTSGTTTTVSYNGTFAVRGVASRNGIIMAVTSRAVGAVDNISGTYARTCPTGTARSSSVFTPYYAYNGNGLTGSTGTTDTGYWNATGFAPTAGADDTGSWNRVGYSGYTAQPYGFRVASSDVICTNNQTGKTMNLAGWVTFYLKSSSSRYTYGGPGVGSGTVTQLNITAATMPEDGFVYADPAAGW